MDEIQAKYVINDFKERTGKQKGLKFEEINLDLYRPSTRCVAFTTSKDRILHWIKTLQYCYFETLKDDHSYLIQWIDHANYTSTTFQEIEIKLFKLDPEAVSDTCDLSQHPDDTSDTRNTLIITVHVYLTTGVIMFQGLAYKFWADREFPILKELTDFSVSQHNQQDPVSKERNFPISGTCPNGVVVQEDKALHQNLNEVLKILPDKKTKLRSQKISQPNFD